MSDSKMHEQTTEGGAVFTTKAPPWYTGEVDLDNFSDELLDDIIDSAFKKLSSGFSGYQTREAQVKMSRRVLRSMVYNHTFVVEAGTGVGKSFGYLIPSLAYTYLCGERVVVTTETKSLQMQLYEKDMPVIQKLLCEDISYELALGSSNYFCRLRYDDAFISGAHRDIISEKQEKYFHEWIENVSNKKYQGHQFELKEKIPKDFWSLVGRDPDGCPGNRCSLFSGCNYYRVKAAWNESRILIANHHLFLYNILNEKRTLPSYGAVVLDEAHGIIKTGQSIFTQSFYMDAMRDLQKKFDRALGKSLPIEAKQEWADLWSRALSNWDVFFSAWEVELDLSFEDEKSAIITEPSGIEVTNLSVISEEIYNQLKELTEDENDSNLLNSVNSIVKAFSKVRKFLKSYETFDMENFVYWGEKNRSKLTMHSCNLGIGDVLAPEMVEAQIWTSATLGYWPNPTRPAQKKELIEYGYFSNFISQAIGEPNRDEVKLDYYSSPFDYSDNTAIYIPTHLKVPPWGSSGGITEAYEQDLVSEIVKLIQLSGGGALVLFTSHYMLRRVTEELEGLIDYPVFSQSVDGAEGALEKFRNTPDSVLLGTNMYWQGIDVMGRQLRMLIITKLMFTPPDDPIFSARAKILEKNNQSSFFNLSLPNSSTMLRQAFGRLIRNENDTGVISILDSRIMEKSYGRILLANLPASPVITKFTELKEKVEKYGLL